MREIKFRAWDGEKMHRVIYYKGGNLCVVPLKRFPMQEEIVFENIMQYTGLKDMNGTEIYEDDICDISKFENKEIYRSVVNDIKHIPDCFYGSNINWIEIIGNIHENSELL